MISRVVLLVVLVLAVPELAAGKSLHVNSSGTPACSDSTAYATNTANQPWCTIGRAAWGSVDPNAGNPEEAAQAGDTVSIAAGTYTTSGPRTSCASGARWQVALNPANSGTSGAPITFLGIGAVNIYLAAGYFGPTIGANSRNYVVWDNVRIDEQTAPGTSCGDTGPVVVHDTTGSKILNTTVRGSFKGWSDNYNGIRFEAVNGGVVANSTIYDITCNWGTNCAGIMTYDTANSVFEHNKIYNTATAIFIKGDHAGDGWPQIGNVVRGNWIENTTSAGVYGISAAGSRIYQNLLKDNNIGVRFNVLGPGTDDVFVVNNTFVSTNALAFDAGYSVNSLIADMMNVRVHNNLFAGSWSEAINLSDAPSLGTHSFQHNVYFGFDVFGSLNGAQISFNTWKATHGQDNGAPAGINADPLFVDSVTYKLAAGSPARTVGVDLLDLNGDGNSTDIIPAGAYISGSEVLGPGGSGTTPPNGGGSPADAGNAPGDGGAISEMLDGGATDGGAPAVCAEATCPAAADGGCAMAGAGGGGEAWVFVALFFLAAALRRTRLLVAP